MDTGTITLIATGLAIITLVLITLFVLTRQSNRLEEQMREANSELRQAISELANRFGKRISDVEREQARLDGANSVMQVQAHTHASSTRIADD